MYVVAMCTVATVLCMRERAFNMALHSCASVRGITAACSISLFLACTLKFDSKTRVQGTEFDLLNSTKIVRTAVLF